MPGWEENSGVGTNQGNATEKKYDNELDRMESSLNRKKIEPAAL